MRGCVVVSGLAVSRGLLKSTSASKNYKGMLLQGYNVPPDMTMLAYKSRRISTSHFMMVWKVLQGTIVVDARNNRCVCKEDRVGRC